MTVETDGICRRGNFDRWARILRSLLRPKLLLGAAAAVAAVLAIKHYVSEADVKHTLLLISGLGPWAPISFIGIYIIAAVLFIPGTILTMSAGFLFGLAYGTAYVSIGATLGATCAFLVARYLARERVAKSLEHNSSFKAIDQAVGREGWKIVGLARLSPIFPFNLLNYAFGLTGVGLGDYFLASWAGMLPGTFMYVYVGTLARDLTRVGSGSATSNPARWMIEIAGFVATAVLVVYVTRLARQALHQKTREEETL